MDGCSLIYSQGSVQQPIKRECQRVGGQLARAEGPATEAERAAEHASIPGSLESGQTDVVAQQNKPRLGRGDRSAAPTGALGSQPEHDQGCGHRQLSPGQHPEGAEFGGESHRRDSAKRVEWPRAADGPEAEGQQPGQCDGGDLPADATTEEAVSG